MRNTCMVLTGAIIVAAAHSLASMPDRSAAETAATGVQTTRQVQASEAKPIANSFHTYLATLADVLARAE